MSKTSTGTSPRIKVADPRANYLAHKEEIDAAIARVLERGSYVMAEEVEAFEEEWARYCGVKYCVGVSSCTDALKLALSFMPLPGVDIPAYTFMATFTAVMALQMEADFCDVSEANGNLDLRALERDKELVLLPVFMYGNPFINGLQEIIEEEYDFPMVIDAAQGHGAPLPDLERYQAACYSFYPTKNLGALGQAGAVVTNDHDLYQRIRRAREYNERERFVYYPDRVRLPGGPPRIVAGANYRMDELQAAILRAKLPFLNGENERRREIAAQYNAGLPRRYITLPELNEGHVMHAYAIRVDGNRRKSLTRWLSSQGIDTSIRYPVPLHKQPMTQLLVNKELSLPNAEAWAEEVLNLPMYPELTSEEVETVISQVRAWEEQQ